MSVINHVAFSLLLLAAVLRAGFLLLLVEVLEEDVDLLVEILVEAVDVTAPAVPVALAGAVPVAGDEGHVRKPDKTALLLVVGTLVRRRSRISNFLQHRSL